MELDIIKIGLIILFAIIILVVLYLTIKKRGKPPIREISPMGISQIVQEEIEKRNTIGGHQQWNNEQT